jgi:protein-S-isoprenylcysteine O-methyltransferase Ste14
MGRSGALVYGIVCYGVFFGTFLALVGFLGGFGPLRTIDSGPTTSPGLAVAINTLLLVLFAVQHSVMARPAFKEVFTQAVPRPIERSTYVLASSLVLVLLMALWQPIPRVVWQVTDPVGHALLSAGFFAGVGLVLLSTFLLDHFDLFGLRQVWLHFRGRPYQHRRFDAPFLYRQIRHPLYVGWFATMWLTPTMSAGHLLFAAVATGYVLVAIGYEERDLLRFLGDDYRRWRDRTPMFFPRLGRGRPSGFRPGEVAGSRRA